MSERSRAPLMSGLVIATVMGSLDSSFVPLTFQDLIVKLDTSTSVVVWVALGYLIAATGPMLFFARLGDRSSHARLFRLGTLVYGAAMTACGLAPDVAWLIALRCVQGLGMALFLPATFALAARAYPANERGRALGILASANAFGFILGPLFAGFLLDAYDWRATFLTRTPVALLSVILAFAVVRDPAGSSAARATAGLDQRGALLLTGGLFGLLFGLNRLPVEDNHREPLPWAILLIGLALLALFVRAERRHPEPLVDVSLFAEHPRFSKAALAFTILFATFPVYLFILPIVLLAGLEYAAWDAGLLLGSVALITFFVSPWAGRASDRVGAEQLCVTGAVLTGLGYLALLLIGPASGATTILLPMALIGFGTGLFFSPNSALIIGGVPPARAGMASGMIGTMRQAGYAVGFALMASLFSFVQTRFELAWSRDGLRELPEPMAARLSHVYEAGGPWSPEMLAFVLHVGALLAAALTLFTAFYSRPGMRMSRDGQLVAAGFVFLLTTAAVLRLSSTSVLRLAESAWIPPRPPRPALAVAAFGMTERRPRLPPRTLDGRQVFALYCASCHGPEGRGLENLGLDLTTSKFVAQKQDAELAAFLRDGRAPDAKDSQTKRLMPAMRNYAGFGEESYRRVVEHVRKLNRASTAAGRN